MKLTNLATATLLTTACLATAATAENLDHVKQLLSTKQCPNCSLTGAGFVLSDLSQVNLQGADLSRANLSRANLTGADLTGANLAGAGLFGANLSGANLTGADLRGADLRNSYMVGADLRGAKLDYADLQGVVGLAPYVDKAEDFYGWGLAAAQQEDYNRAIENFNRALEIKPGFAPAYLARGVARFPIGDVAGAKGDAQQAAALFSMQGDAYGYQNSQGLMKTIESYEEALKRQDKPRGGGLGGFFNSLGPLLLRFLF